MPLAKITSRGYQHNRTSRTFLYVASKTKKSCSGASREFLQLSTNKPLFTSPPRDSPTSVMSQVAAQLPGPPVASLGVADDRCVNDSGPNQSNGAGEGRLRDNHDTITRKNTHHTPAGNDSSPYSLVLTNTARPRRSPPPPSAPFSQACSPAPPKKIKGKCSCRPCFPGGSQQTFLLTTNFCLLFVPPPHLHLSHS